MELDRPARTAVLIVRLWREPVSAAGLRIRIVSTSDVERGDELSWSTASVEEAVKQVESWLRAHAAPRAER